MTACAPMQELGRVDGVTWYWAEPGRFSEPGVYYWNGKENVRVAAALAGEPAVAADEGREDTKRLNWLYSGARTDSNAMVELELRVLNGDYPTPVEVRAAIDAARAASQYEQQEKQQ